MTLKKLDKSGLVNALKNGASSPKPEPPSSAQQRNPSKVIYCEAKNCNGNKISKQFIEGGNGAFNWITGRASSREQRLIAINTAEGVHLGHICQECYDIHLYKNQKGRLSHIQRDADMLTAEQVKAYDPAMDREIDIQLNPPPTFTPNALQMHLASIDELADRLKDREP
jgi:hypothetical protein